MIRLFILVISWSLCSCASNNSFQKFYNKEKSEADFALAFPKYMAMVAIPKDSKEDVKHFTQGMKRIRVLYNKREDQSLFSSFVDFAENHSFLPYIVVKNDGSKMNLFTREDNAFIREIVIEIESEDEIIIVALLGKMSKHTFNEALKEAGSQEPDFSEND